jgi:hypothetical protein
MSTNGYDMSTNGYDMSTNGRDMSTNGRDKSGPYPTGNELPFITQNM